MAESSGGLREPQITLRFSFEASLVFDVRILPLSRVNKFLDAGESATGGCGAGLDGLVGAVEVIPRERLDVGAQDQVGVALPYFELMFLGGAYGTADYLENVGWSAAVHIVEAHRNADHPRGPKFAGGARWNLSDKTAIGEAARSNLYGFEQSRESAARADRFAQISVRENYRFAIGQIRCDHSHRDLEIFKAPRFEDLLDKVAKPVIAGEPQAGNAPPGDVAETKRTASSDDARQGRAAGIRRAEDAADARTSDERNWNAILFENLQNAEMRESPGEAAA